MEHVCPMCEQQPCHCANVTMEDWLEGYSWNSGLDTHEEVIEHGRD